MTFPVTHPISYQRLVTVFFRQRLPLRKLTDNVVGQIFLGNGTEKELKSDEVTGTIKTPYRFPHTALLAV